jgi:hypothetical protein
LTLAGDGPVFDGVQPQDAGLGPSADSCSSRSGDTQAS